MTLPDREADRLSLHRKSYEAKLVLLETIGPKYNVRVYPSKEGRHPTDQMKTTMIRECKTHGKVEVKLAAFVVRGNFACHMCVADEQAKALRKPERLRTSVTKSGKAHVYIAMSECGNYVKVGYTAQKPDARIKQVNSKCPILFNRYRHCTTTGTKAFALESFLKRALAKFVQTDLGEFSGSTEVFDLRKVGITVSDIISKFSLVIGKSVEAGDKITSEDVDFAGETIVKIKRFEVDARVVSELKELTASANEEVSNFKRWYPKAEIGDAITVLEINRGVTQQSIFSLTVDGKELKTSFGLFLSQNPDDITTYLWDNHGTTNQCNHNQPEGNSNAN